MVEQVATLFEQPSMVKEFLEKIHQAKPRYIRDQLVSVRGIINDLGSECVFRAIAFCLENGIYEATSLKSVAEKFACEQKQKAGESNNIIKLLPKPESLMKASIKPLKSNITDYEHIIHFKKQGNE